MPSTRNLTQIEAAERARLLEVTDYDIALDLTGDLTFRSRTTVRFTCTAPGASTFIEVAAAKLHAAQLNGMKVDISAWSAEAGLILTNLQAENTLTVDADFAYSTSGQGLHRSTDPVDGNVYLYSQFEIADAQRVFACFDQPDLKSVYTWHIRCPSHWTVISNACIARAGAERSAATREVHFERSVRMSTYITAICAGPYHEVRQQHENIDLGLFVRESMKQYLDSDELFTITRQGLDFFQREFEYPYPLPKYDHVYVPEFNAAAMENFGCVVLGEERGIFRSAVTEFEREQRAADMLHEMAHMWFGNLVTMRWWDDLWLKESFAEWAAYWCAVAATRFTDAWTGFLSIRKTWAYRQDQLSSTHPVYSAMPDIASVEVNFDGITYAKGASVLKQLVAYLGNDTFVAGLRRYFAAHAWSNATFDDLLRALDEENQHQLREFASEWLQTSEVNTLRPQISVGPDGNYDSVVIQQEAPPQHPTLRSHRLAIGLYDLEGDRLKRRQRVELVVSGPRTEVGALKGARAADVLLLNDDDLTYAKIRLDSRSLRTVREHLSSLDSSLGRALCWAATWDMLRDAELAARDFVGIVCSVLPNETDVNLVTSVLRQAQTAIELYADTRWAPSGRQQLAKAAIARLETGALQLVWARSFIWAAQEVAELTKLQQWLAGEGVPGGLRVDAELRWSIILHLVALGVASEADIANEEQRDQTSSGAESAATARALLPTADSKATAWRRLTTESLPNWLQRALLDGFYHPTQLELTRRYISSYFEVIGPFCASHDLQTAHGFVIGAYPSIYVEQSVVDASDRWIADESQPQAVRRLVQEGRDGVLRALGARARDAAEASDGRA